MKLYHRVEQYFDGKQLIKERHRWATFEQMEKHWTDDAQKRDLDYVEIEAQMAAEEHHEDDKMLRVFAAGGHQ